MQGGNRSWIDSSQSSQTFLLAHQLGHNLGLDHASAGNDTLNLMFNFSLENVPSSLTDFHLTADQVSKVLESNFVYDAPAAGNTPLPGALPLFASGLGALGLLGWRRKRKAAALAA